jgi:hypothetical protein
MQDGRADLSFNIVEFELLKPYQNSGTKSRTFWKNNNWTFPGTSEHSIYYHSIPAEDGSFELFQNTIPLEENVQYTYSRTNQRVTFINNTTTNSGIFHCRYIPESSSLKFGTIPKSTIRTKGLTVNKVGSAYYYELIKSMRLAIENLWTFLKKDTFPWVGGIQNQTTGRDNIIKYITPITNTHLAEIVREIEALNQYIGLKFNASVQTNYPKEIDKSFKITTKNIEDMLLSINEIENVMTTVANINKFKSELNL